MNQREDWDGLEGGSEKSLAEFELHLAQALRRVDAPEGFAERVMGRAQAVPRSRVVVMRPKLRMWVGGAIAAALLAGAFSAEQIRVRRQHEQAEMARQQFEAGIRITDDALDHAREQLEHAGVGLGQ